MRIGIIGSGKIGGTLAMLLDRAGHEVTLANRRGPGSLGDAVAALGPGARAGTIDEAAGAELVVVAMPFAARGALPAGALAGRALVGGLIDAIGFDPVKTGSLADGRRQQPGTPVYNQPFTAQQAREALAS